MRPHLETRVDRIIVRPGTSSRSMSMTLSATMHPISSIAASSACLPERITRTRDPNIHSVPAVVFNPTKAVFRCQVSRLISGSLLL